MGYASLAEQRPAEAAETYAQTLETLKRLGASAITGVILSDSTEQRHGVETEAYMDFFTGAAENIGTDPEFASSLNVDREREMTVQGGHVVTAEGIPMTVVTRRGLGVSRRAAKVDYRMRTQARRDIGDVRVADFVDQELAPGAVYVVMSKDPRCALQTDPKFWRGKGYREGLGFLQVYYKSPDGQSVVAGSYSVDSRDAARWRVILNRHGANLPEGLDDSSWTQFGFTQHVKSDEASGIADGLRREFYESDGEVYSRLSVADFLHAREGLVRAYFDRYIMPLAQAVYSGRNNPVMQGLAHALQSTAAIHSLKPEMRRELLQVANGERFTGAAGQAMEKLIRYALVEELRTSLAGVFTGRGVAYVNTYTATDWGAQATQLYQQLALHIARGVTARREYGGCAALELDGQADSGRSTENPQDAFGGKSEWKRMTCPFCGDANQYGDPCSPNQYCTNCRAHVHNSKVISSGDGGARSRSIASRRSTQYLFNTTGNGTERLQGILSLLAA